MIRQRTLHLVLAWGMCFGLLALGGLTLTPPTRALAQEAPDQAIHIEIRTIYATTDNKGVDDKLQHLESKLTKVFKDYKTFKELAQHKASIGPGGTYEFSIPGGTHLRITHKGQAEKLLKLNIGVDNKFQSDIRVSQGSTFFQAGLPHGSGILILAITVR